MISDLGIDCTYFTHKEDVACYDESGYSFWITPLYSTLWERMKDSPLFPGLRCKIYSVEGKLLAWQDFPVGESSYVSLPLYTSDTFDGSGSSYADFFYTDLLHGMNFSGVVVDAGAHNGFFTLKALKEGAHRVYLIEPDVSPFYYAQLNYRSDPRVVLLNKALSSNTNPIDFWLSGTYSVGNSAVYWTEESTKTTVECVDIPSILSVESKVSLVKLDIEGTEYEVIRALDDSHFDKVDQWFIEYHSGPQDLEEILKSRGYITEYRNTNFENPYGYIWAHR